MDTGLKRYNLIPEFICYNWMPLISDHILDIPESFYASAGTSRLHDVDSFNPYLVQDGDLIFVKTDFIVNGVFVRDFLPKIPPNRIFNLITGVSSYHLGRDDQGRYKEIINHPGLNKWICTNPPNEKNNKFIPIPIGFQEGDRPGGDQKFLKRIMSGRTDFSNKENKIFLPWHKPSTNPKRQQMIDSLKNLPFVVYQEDKQNLEDYYDSMNRYKFIIGLEGSGPDIHRNYESLLVGSVPINIKNTIENVFLFHDAEAIFLNSWNELDEELFNNIIVRQYNTLNNDKFLSCDHHIQKIKNIIGK